MDNKAFLESFISMLESFIVILLTLDHMAPSLCHLFFVALMSVTMTATVTNQVFHYQNG